MIRGPEARVRERRSLRVQLLLHDCFAIFRLANGIYHPGAVPAVCKSADPSKLGGVPFRKFGRHTAHASRGIAKVYFPHSTNSLVILVFLYLILLWREIFLVPNLDML